MARHKLRETQALEQAMFGGRNPILRGRYRFSRVDVMLAAQHEDPGIDLDSMRLYGATSRVLRNYCLRTPDLDQFSGKPEWIRRDCCPADEALECIEWRARKITDDYRGGKNSLRYLRDVYDYMIEQGLRTFGEAEQAFNDSQG